MKSSFPTMFERRSSKFYSETHTYAGLLLFFTQSIERLSMWYKRQARNSLEISVP